MCYIVYVSTDSHEDLARHNTELLVLGSLKGDEGNPFKSLLKNPNRWHVGSKSGCGCTFRHLVSTKLGFGEPVDWYEEEPDEINATRELFRLIRPLIIQGYCVDILSIWEGSNPQDVTEMDIDISVPNESTFRLFENHHFIFHNSKEFIVTAPGAR